MKSNSKNLIVTLFVIIILGTGAYYFWDREQKPIEETNITLENEVTNVGEAIVEFNLPNTTSHQVVERSFYTFSYNEKHEQPDWIAYTLYPIADSLRVKRKDAFRKDPLVTTGSATLKDYKKSGYDRGHLAPAKAMSYSKEAMSASFFMSNMSPQVPSFNRGIWKKLEAEIYKWSLKSDSLYVVTGPVFTQIIDTIGENNVSVPKYYYKTILKFKDDSINGIGFLLENKKSSKSYFDFVVSIDSIEKITGVDFYYQLDSLKQSKLEENINTTFFKN